MTARTVYALLGAACLAAALALPTVWYRPLPLGLPGAPDPPFNGAVVFKYVLALNGLALLVLGASPFSAERTGAHLRLPARVDDGMSRQRAAMLVAVATIVAALLRVVQLGSELWLDEISPRNFYDHASALAIVISFPSTNNHLLTTLLVNGGVAVAGEREWVVRLPAAVFGVATIPVMYLLARTALSRASSAAAAAILAVSYHHVFFSQNARGYTAHLLFSGLATLFLIRALTGGRTRGWVAFAAASVLNVASIVAAASVLAAHAFIAAVAVIVIAARVPAADWRPVAFRAAVSCTAAGLLALLLYAAAIPQMIVYIRTTYVDPAAGFAPGSLELVREIIRGLAAGVPPAVATLGAVAGALPVVAGFQYLLRRNWVLVCGLLLPPTALAALLLARSLMTSPRFFVVALLLGLLCVAACGEWLAQRLRRGTAWHRIRMAAAVAVVCAAAVSAVQLRAYYSLPKQAYKSSLEYVQSIRRTGDVVVPLHLMHAGYAYYSRVLGISIDDYQFVRSLDDFNAVLERHAGRRIILVSTFPRALRIELPDVARRVEEEWQVHRVFPASVGDAQVIVWLPKRGY